MLLHYMDCLKLQAHDLWRSVQLEASDLEPYLTNVHDKALKHSLQYGVGFLHETMSAGEQEIVNRLFNNGAIQVRSSGMRIPPMVLSQAPNMLLWDMFPCCLPALYLQGPFVALPDCASAANPLLLCWVVPSAAHQQREWGWASHLCSTLSGRLRVWCMAAGAGGDGAHVLGHGRGGLAGGHHGHAVL